MNTQDLQSNIIQETEQFRSNGSYRIDVPFRWTSNRFEHYFFGRFFRERPETKRVFLPVDWWNFHAFTPNDQTRMLDDLLKYYKTLDNSHDYFMVATKRHAGSVPTDTIIYSGGGVYGRFMPFSEFGNYFYSPIPLLQPKFEPVYMAERSIFATFSGFYETHEIRQRMLKRLHGLSTYKLTPRISHGHYLANMGQAQFALCPAGTGPTSFRLYEAMLCGAVPVYISEEFYLPYADRFDWEQLSVFVKSDDIEQLPDILESIPNAQIESMRKAIAVFSDELSFDATYRRIIEDVRHR